MRVAPKSITPGQRYSVELAKNSEGSLGVSLIGHRDAAGASGIYVVSITPGGSADTDGRIELGDQVISINDVELTNKSQKETFSLIANSPTSAKITLIRSHTGEVPTPPPPATSGSTQRHPPPTVEDELDRLKIHVSKRDIDNVEVIKLVKDFNGLGISFEDDTPSGVKVRSLSANGPASRDGRLLPGDRVLAVNEVNCQRAAYREVTDILKASRGTIKLVVLHSPRRRDSKGSRGSNTSGSRAAERDIQTGVETEIEIIKGNSGLGLSIAGGAETVLGCVLVHEVYPGSAAHSDGRLQAGDRILAVNGVDISAFSHNQASDVLRKAGGVVKLRIIRDETNAAETIKVRLNKVRYKQCPSINGCFNRVL